VYACGWGVRLMWTHADGVDVHTENI